MTRVLAYTSPARGHLFPVTPILDELVARGHEVALRTLASQVEPMGERGFDAAPIDPAIERIEHDDYLARTPLGAQNRAMRLFCARAEYDARDLRRAIEEVRPDLLLVGARVPAAGTRTQRRAVNASVWHAGGCCGRRGSRAAPAPGA